MMTEKIFTALAYDVSEERSDSTILGGSAVIARLRSDRGNLRRRDRVVIARRCFFAPTWQS